ncbi:MAG: ABC transporter ATP-binding protein [Planctomycetes bacterium]|nr:ABC transporter ATP-binding protein [Planctomycetota bacterium]MCC7395800.1 ABC transporter ATP-binding protein [Planctomycetota bacterium]
MKLTANDLQVGYGGPEVLRGVGLDVPEGALVGLVGPNGAGKSTLLRCLAGLQTPHAGSITIDGQAIADLSAREIARRIAVVPQYCSPALPVSVAQFVGMGRFSHERFFGGPTRHDHEVVAQSLAEMSLTALADRAIDALSGGEFRRVLIAQAMAQQPTVLLLDEPVQQLDLLHQLEVMQFARSFVRRQGKAGVVVLHELGLAARYCDEIVLLHGGRVMASGPAEAVLTKDHLRTAYGVEAEIARCAHTGALTIVAIGPAG